MSERIPMNQSSRNRNLNRAPSMSGREGQQSQVGRMMDDAADKAEEIDVFQRLEAYRIRAKKFMNSSSFGRTYDNCLLCLSVFSSLQFIYQTYINVDTPSGATQKKYFTIVEMSLAALFSWDWILSFSLADHKWEHVQR